MIEFKILEDEMNKIKRTLDDTMELLKAKDRKLTMEKYSASQYQKYYQTTCNEIKDLKEKGNENM